jgi:nicotinamide mononucleotide (NMN) deamidase PncC
MSGAHLNTDWVSAWTGVDGSSHRTESLGEHYVGSAMDQPEGLAIAVNRHSGCGSIRRNLLQFDAHS